MSDRTTTLSEVIRAAQAEAAGKDKPEGVWADQFDVIVKRGEPKNGNKPSKASVYDPHNGTEGKLVWFGGDLRDFENKTVRIGGKGNKAKEYGGNVEISVGKNGRIDVIGDAPKSQPAPPAGSAPAGNATQTPPPVEKPKVDPVTYFHREMEKTALLYSHAFQYALNAQSKLGVKMPEPQFQAVVSSLFIAADRHGLGAKVPALRTLDDKGVPFRYVPPAPDPAVVEAERLRKEAEAEAKRKAEEAEKAAAAARAAASSSHQQHEDLDQDVPF